MLQENKTVSVLDTSIRDCDFTMRLQNTLVTNGVDTVRQALAFSEEQILGFNYMGRKTFDELRDYLNNNELELAGDDRIKALKVVREEMHREALSHLVSKNKTVIVLDTLIKDCYFTVGLRNILTANGVHDVKQLLALSQEQIFDFQFISKYYLGELRYFLKQNGLKLSGYVDRKPKAEVDVVFDRPIKHCGFKAGRLLISWDILTVGELIKHSEKSLLNIPGLGPVYVGDIKHVLLANGLGLTDNLTKSLQEETKKGMQLDLSPTDSNSKQVIELWIELNEPLLAEDDNQLMKAKCFLANINRR